MNKAEAEKLLARFDKIAKDKRLSISNRDKAASCLVVTRIALRQFGDRNDISSTLLCIQLDLSMLMFQIEAKSSGIPSLGIKELIKTADQIYEAIQTRVVKK